MNSQDLYTKYNWSPAFKELSQWGQNLIDEEKAQGLSKITSEKHNIVNRVIDKDLPDWITGIFKVPVSHVQLFSAEPAAIGSVHKDGLDRLCAFNIPVSNTDIGWMEWLEGPVFEKKISLKHTSIRLLQYQKQASLMNVASKILLEQPTLINTNEWHRVDNSDNPNWRHVLSVRFLNNPSYNSVKDILDSYL